MKLSVLDWLLWVVKAVVSALLFVFMGIGGILVTRSAWTSANWLLELQAAWAQQQPLIIIVGLVVVVLWLLLIRHFYEAVLLNRLIEAVSDLAPRVRDTESEGLPEKRWGRRLRPARKDLVKYANTAFSKAGQMKSLVEDLFDYTQVHQVDFKLRWAPLDLAAMLQQLAVNYELEAKNKHVVVSAVTNPDTIEMVGDPDRLARVFMNLINNALKYGDGATFVRLTAKTNKSENYVEVRVQNNGEKIPADSIKRLFDRFYRVESSRNTKTGGTGLGLAIVNGVVEAHGGTVRVESDDDLTSFIVQLPLQPELGNEA